ncbi:glutathione S-transferase family protein [Halomonas denitrificans]|nr:glutathione S-transferase family protein [Halomonas denitrificans]
MKLYGSYTSPYVRHCRVALIQQGLEFDFVETDYAASARQSPTRRVPFLEVDGLRLTDSSSILRWTRERQGGAFLSDPAAFDRYLLATTALDSTVNLFLLERDGLRPDDVPYLGRQRDRVESSLVELDRRFDGIDPGDDDGLRLACYLSWAAFRERIDAQPFRTLGRVLAYWEEIGEFSTTHPGRAG